MSDIENWQSPLSYPQIFFIACLVMYRDAAISNKLSAEDRNLISWAVKVFKDKKLSEKQAELFRDVLVQFDKAPDLTNEMQDPNTSTHGA